MCYWVLRFILSLIIGLDLLLASLCLYCCSFLPEAWTASWYRPLFQAWCWIFIRALGVRLCVHQQYQAALPEQFIVIANHPSAFEDIGMPALFNARFLAKEELRDWWILGRISLFARTLYVKREAKESRKAAFQSIIDTLNQGHNIGLYPEGGCHGRRIFLPFQYGIFEAARQTKTPIIPVFIHYEAQADFEWGPKEPLLQALWNLYRSKNKIANYYVLDPINPLLFDSKESLCDHVQNLYLAYEKKYLEALI